MADDLSALDLMKDWMGRIEGKMDDLSKGQSDIRVTQTENTGAIRRIEQQTTQTNGRVTKLEEALDETRDRVGRLEHHRTWIAGIGAAVMFLLGLIKGGLAFSWIPE